MININRMIKVKVKKVIPVLTNYAQSHEGIWRSGYTDPYFFDLSTSWSGQLHAPGKNTPVPTGQEVG
jgi:hypothetical protein